MDFGEALKQLRTGKRVRRAGWNGKGMWLVLVSGGRGVDVAYGTVYSNAGVHTINIDPHIDMFTAHGSVQPGWIASQADMLAGDWEIVE